MLYDPKWEKPNVRSIESLIAWLEKQPCDGTYDFTEPSACLLAQYLKFHGATERHDYALGSGEAIAYFGDDGVIIHGMPGAKGRADRATMWTFGAALERARAAMTAGM